MLQEDQNPDEEFKLVSGPKGDFLKKIQNTGLFLRSVVNEMVLVVNLTHGMCVEICVDCSNKLFFSKIVWKCENY